MPSTGREFLKERADRFQARRRRFLVSYTGSLVLGVLTVLATVVEAPHSFAYALAALVAVLLVTSQLVYRCTACEKVPYKWGGYHLNPVECPRCGALLKWPREGSADA
jgi:DNA-directed RNA polymerase subunit RPC12/RpoP